MKFTTGTTKIEKSFFTVKRVEDEKLELNHNVEIGSMLGKEKATGKIVYLYHNVPGAYVKIGENVYTRDGKFLGYRSE